MLLNSGAGAHVLEIGSQASAERAEASPLNQGLARQWRARVWEEKDKWRGARTHGMCGRRQSRKINNFPIP